MSPALTPTAPSSVLLLLSVLPLWERPPFSSEKDASQGKWELWEKPSQTQLPFPHREEEHRSAGTGGPWRAKSQQGQEGPEGFIALRSSRGPWSHSASHTIFPCSVLTSRSMFPGAS